MSAMYRTVGLLAMAFIFAVASFQDRIAFSMGKVALGTVVGVLAFVVLGAALALVRGGKPAANVFAETSAEPVIDVDPASQSPS